MSDIEKQEIDIKENSNQSRQYEEYQRGLKNLTNSFETLRMRRCFDLIRKTRRKGLAVKEIKTANMNRDMFNYILKRKQLQLSELRSKSPFRGGNKSRYGDDLHSRAGKRAFIGARGKSRKFRKWGKGDKAGETGGWGQSGNERNGKFANGGGGEGTGKFRNRSAMDKTKNGNGGIEGNGGGAYRNKSTNYKTRNGANSNEYDDGEMNNVNWNKFKTEGQHDNQNNDYAYEDGDNFNQRPGYQNFRKNINKLNNRENNGGDNNDFISFTKNESTYNRKNPLGGWHWEKRKLDLIKQYPNLNEQEIMNLLKNEFALRILNNIFDKKEHRNKSSTMNRLSRFLGKHKRDKITLMFLESILKNIKDKNQRSFFNQLRPKTKNSKSKTTNAKTKTVTVTKTVVRTIDRKIKQNHPDKYILLLLDQIRKDKLRNAIQMMKVTSLFKKLKSQPGGMLTIEHIQNVKRGVTDGISLDSKLIAVLLDKIISYNQRKQKRQAMDSLKDLDMEARKVIYGKVSKIKDTKSVSGKNHPMFRYLFN
jgi:hypothetical protein